MRKKIQAMGYATSLLGNTATAAFSQSADDHRKMEKISTEEKAALIDKMPSKDRMPAMKMGGHDASKMSAQDKRMKLMMGHGMMI